MGLNITESIRQLEEKYNQGEINLDDLKLALLVIESQRTTIEKIGKKIYHLKENLFRTQVSLERARNRIISLRKSLSK